MYNQIFGIGLSTKKKKKKACFRYFEPCQIWISEIQPWSRPTNVVLDTRCSRNIHVLYTYLIRENGINFLSQREESGSRERQGGREGGPKRKAALRALCSYTVRGKSFSLWKINSNFITILSMIFPNIFSELLWNVLYLLLSTHRRIIIKNLRARKIYENVRLISEAYIHIYCRKFNRHLKIDTSTGGLRFLRNTVCTMYVRSRISFLGHSKRKLPPTVSSLVVLPHVNKSTAWIHNCVSSAVLLCTQKRVCTDEDIDDTSVCTCVRMRERKREREKERTETESRLINNGDNSITMRKRGEGVAGNGARYPPMSSTHRVRGCVNI